MRGSAAKFGLVELLDRASHLGDPPGLRREQIGDLGSSELRPEIGMVHDEGPRAAEPVPYRVCGSHRTAGIARSRLHIDPAKRRQPADLAIGNGVHRASAGERDIAQREPLLQRAEQVKKRRFIGRLHRMGDVAVAILERVPGPAARPQQIFQRRGKQIRELRRARRP